MVHAHYLFGVSLVLVFLCLTFGVLLSVDRYISNEEGGEGVEEKMIHTCAELTVADFTCLEYRFTSTGGAYAREPHTCVTHSKADSALYPVQ